MAKLTVLGAGMMGSALSVPLADRGHDVRLVGTHLDEDIVESLRSTRVHPKLKQQLPDSIRPYPVAELDAALDEAQGVILGVSSAGVRWAARQLAAHLTPTLPVLMVSKGLAFEQGQLQVLPEVFRNELPGALAFEVAPAAIAGPCIAGELARRVETCVVFTGRKQGVLDQFESWLGGDYYHVFTSTDLVGVEAAAALKNAYAMGIAFAAGLHEKAGGTPGSVATHNYEAAVFAQAVIEMHALVRALGGKPESVVGLPGVGDLNVTCNGGRTGRFGRFLGMGLGVAESIRRMEGATLECLEILGVMEQALPGLKSRTPGEFPLLRHMIAVALHDEPVAMPFSAFSASVVG